jgi:hypothetical protein
MSDFAQDPLAQRLRQLEVATPDAARVTAAVLAAHRSGPAGVRGRFVIALAMVPVVMLIATAIAAYIAPAFSQALADAPIAGRVAGPVLRQYGLASIENRVSSFGDRSASSGYTLELVAGYADSFRTVLFIRATPAGGAVGLLSSNFAQLRDQFGREYRRTGGFSNSETGDAAITFVPIEWPANRLGARLTLAVTRLEDRNPAQPIVISGSWELRGTLLPEEGTDLPLPGPGDLGGAQVTFTKLRALPATLLVEFEMTGIGSADLFERIPDGLKGRPAFTVRVIDSSGRELRPLSGGGGSAGKANTIRQESLFEVTAPGRYELVLAWEGHGTLTRTLVVP